MRDELVLPHRLLGDRKRDRLPDLLLAGVGGDRELGEPLEELRPQVERAVGEGPGARRIVMGTPWPGDPLPLRLAGLLEEDGALFCRYRTLSAPAATIGA